MYGLSKLLNKSWDLFRNDEKTVEILLDDLTHPDVLALLQAHLDDMRENSPEDSSYALDLSGLQAADVSFWVVWVDGEVAGCGALRELSPTSGEIKSMRTHAGHLRQGVAAKMLEYIIEVAKARGYASLSLETGYGPVFEPALKLYQKYGFKSGEAFSDYRPSAFNQFFHLKLS